MFALPFVHLSNCSLAFFLDSVSAVNCGGDVDRLGKQQCSYNTCQIGKMKTPGIINKSNYLIPVDHILKL